MFRCRYVEGRWIPSGKAERPPSNAIYVHNESPNFGAHWMKEPVNFSKLKLSNKKSEPGMVRHYTQKKIYIIMIILVPTQEKKKICPQLV